MKKVFSILAESLLIFAAILCTLEFSISAFSFEADLGWLAGGVLLSVLLWETACALPWKRITLAIVAMIHIAAGIFYRKEIFLSGSEVIFTVTKHFSRGYAWFPQLGRATGANGLFFFVSIGTILAFVVPLLVRNCRKLLPAVLILYLFAEPGLMLINFAPKPFWVLGLVFFIGLLVLTQTARTKSVSRAARQGLVLMLPLILFSGQIFLQFGEGQERNADLKELTKNVQQWFKDESKKGGTLITVDSEGIDFSELGYCWQSPLTVMTLRTDAPGEQLYLRGEVFSKLSEKGWEQGTSVPLPKADPADGSMWDVEIKTSRVMDLLYLPYSGGSFLEEITPAKDGSYANKEKIKTYSARFQTFYSGKSCSGPGASYTAAELFLPEETRTLLVSFLSRMEGTDPVKEIVSYLQTNGIYDLSPPRAPKGEDFTYWFLTESMTGYCTHFASAGAALLRAAGIPARVVNGYRAVLPENGEEVRVTGKNKHAWVEYFSADSRWTVLECTPGRDVGESVSSANDSSGKMTAESGPPEGAEFENTEGNDYSKSEAHEDPSPKGGAFVKETPSEQTKTPFVFPKKLLWLLVIPAFFGLIRLRRKLILKLRESRRARADEALRCEMIYYQILRLCEAMKQTPDPFLEQIAERAKYSAHAPSVLDVETLMAAENKLRTTLLGSGSVWKKYWYTWGRIL